MKRAIVIASQCEHWRGNPFSKISPVPPDRHILSLKKRYATRTSFFCHFFTSVINASGNSFCTFFRYASALAVTLNAPTCTR